MRPPHQGRGHDRVLIDHVAGVSRDDAWEAVCLTTETPRDVPYSEHMGYEVLSEVQVGDLHSRRRSTERVTPAQGEPARSPRILVAANRPGAPLTHPPG